MSIIYSVDDYILVYQLLSGDKNAKFMSRYDNLVTSAVSSWIFAHEHTIHESYQNLIENLRETSKYVWDKGCFPKKTIYPSKIEELDDITIKEPSENNEIEKSIKLLHYSEDLNQVHNDVFRLTHVFYNMKMCYIFRQYDRDGNEKSVLYYYSKNKLLNKSGNHIEEGKDYKIKFNIIQNKVYYNTRKISTVNIINCKENK